MDDSSHALRTSFKIKLDANPGFVFYFLSFSAGSTTERNLTTAEWIKSIFAKGMVYTRLFDEKLGVSETAKALATRASETVFCPCWLLETGNLNPWDFSVDLVSV